MEKDQRKIPGRITEIMSAIPRKFNVGQAYVVFNSPNSKPMATSFTDRETDVRKMNVDGYSVTNGKVTYRNVNDAIDVSMMGDAIRKNIVPGNVFSRKDFLTDPFKVTSIGSEGRNPVTLIGNNKRVEVENPDLNELTKISSTITPSSRGQGYKIKILKLRDISDLDIRLSPSLPGIWSTMLLNEIVPDGPLTTFFMIDIIRETGIKEISTNSKVFADDERNKDLGLMVVKSVVYGTRSVYVLKVKTQDQFHQSAFNKAIEGNTSDSRTFFEALRNYSSSISGWEFQGAKPNSMPYLPTSVNEIQERLNQSPPKGQSYPLYFKAGDNMMNQLYLTTYTDALQFARHEIIPKKYKLEITFQNIKNYTKPTETYKLGYKVGIRGVYFSKPSSTITSKERIDCVAFNCYETEEEFSKFDCWNYGAFRLATKAVLETKINQAVTASIMDYDLASDKRIQFYVNWVMMYSTMPLGKDNLGKQLQFGELYFKDLLKYSHFSRSVTAKALVEGRTYEFNFLVKAVEDK